MTEPVDDLVRFGGVISTSVVPSVMYSCSRSPVTCRLGVRPACCRRA